MPRRKVIEELGVIIVGVLAMAGSTPEANRPTVTDLRPAVKAKVQALLFNAP